MLRAAQGADDRSASMSCMSEDRSVGSSYRNTTRYSSLSEGGIPSGLNWSGTADNRLLSYDERRFILPINTPVN